MKEVQPQVIYLSDYKAPLYLIEKTRLNFEIQEEFVVVTSLLDIYRNPEREIEAGNSLELNGDELELLSVKIDDIDVIKDRYQINKDKLIIQDMPERCVLSIQTKIFPQLNTALEGLYKSSGMYCTQCEAEGFRRITYFLDRPDVMSTYEVTITADKSKYPVLLSNGNLIDSQDLDDGRHLTTWHDPHKKPCYLFALVAGDLQHIEDNFVTASGENVTLRIYVEPQNIDKCDYAMGALKRSMKWDEEVYGREYDLNIFNIVAVDDFNMGAMENKSLNIFNSSCVLASPETSTDSTFQRIEAIVAHEYFHNWSGNRVTCRDWFQLSLKEGFTVFRDAEFSADMASRTVKRIEDVNVLKTVQFAEDAGPMAHPIRPASFIEISNFYTVTVYEKGAEVVRMIHNLLGADLFRKGSDLYFSKYDGQAVTTEEFVSSMEEASGVDLTTFRNWYHQAGTPEVEVTDFYDAVAKTYTLDFKQSCRATPESETKQPFHIPVEIGLLLSDGTDAKLVCETEGEFNSNTSVIGLKAQSERFVFTGINEKPVPSLLRGFSAPVKLRYNYTKDQLLFLMANDSDGYNRWDAGQKLAIDIILSLAADIENMESWALAPELISVYQGLLTNTALEKAMIVQMLTLPAVSYLMELKTPADVQALIAAREFVKETLASALKADFLACYQSNMQTGPFELTSDAMAQRSLMNLCLQFLLETKDQAMLEIARKQFDSANNMTDQSAALVAIVNSVFQQDAQEVLAQFYQQWKHNPLVLNMWFSIQAGSDQTDGVDGMNKLLAHSDYDLKNPNKVRSVVGVFAGQNLKHFHDASGRGYEWLADRIIEMDTINPQVASRLLGPFTKWQRLNTELGELMYSALLRIQNHGELSKDVYEVVSKSLVR